MNNLIEQGANAVTQTYALNQYIYFGLGILFLLLAIAAKSVIKLKYHNDDNALAIALAFTGVVFIIAGVFWLLFPQAMLLMRLT